MKKSEIHIGGRYLAKVNGRVVTVRVDDIDDSSIHPNGRKAKVAYYVTDPLTGRSTTFRSAAMFRERR